MINILTLTTNRSQIDTLVYPLQSTGYSMYNQSRASHCRCILNCGIPLWLVRKQAPPGALRDRNQERKLYITHPLARPHRF